MPAALWSATTLAAGPTRDQCIDANEEAQDLRREGSLLEARARLAVCIAPSCPGPVRVDCAERLRVLDDATPTIVLDATDSAGGGPQHVIVTLDGHSIPANTAGAIPVDPGVHQLVFESEGSAATSVTVVVREGETSRRIDAPVAAPSRPGRADLHHPLGVAVGSVGLAGLALGGMFAALAKSTDAHALSGECGGDPHACSAAGARDGVTAQGQARVATIALIGGGTLLGAGAVIYLTAPGERRLSLGPAVGAGRAGLTLKGDF